MENWFKMTYKKALTIAFARTFAIWKLEQIHHSFEFKIF